MNLEGATILINASVNSINSQNSTNFEFKIYDVFNNTCYRNSMFNFKMLGKYILKNKYNFPCHLLALIIVRLYR